jgi:hypothetical protein
MMSVSGKIWLHSYQLWAFSASLAKALSPDVTSAITEHVGKEKNVVFQPGPATIHRLGQWLRTRAALTFELTSRQPQRAQARYLKALLQRNRDSVYGRNHGFDALSSVQAYQARVPLVTAKDMAPWIKRSMAGERQLLTTEAPIFYGMTSGTSGELSYVPITPTYRAELMQTQHVSFWHLFRRFPGAFAGHLLYFVGYREWDRAADGLEIGQMSGFNYTEQRPLIRSLFAWPYELCTLRDQDLRGYLALHQALLKNLTLITGVFPLPIVLFLRRLEGDLEPLIKDLHDGTLCGLGPLPPDVQRWLGRLEPRADLAKRLERAAAAPVEEKVAHLWPDLKLVYCWTTATAGLYKQELQRRLGAQVQIRDAIYAATEAWCNVTLGDVETGGPLALDSVFFEFIPEDAYESGRHDTLLAHELQDGRRYYIVVSNSAGYYRYVVGDIVEVCGFYHATPRIRFVRKGGAKSSMVGELLDETQVNEAVGSVLSELRLEATWFALVADPTRAVPRYRLYFEAAPDHASMTDAELDSLAALVDQRLRQVSHFQYERLRKQDQLAPICPQRLPIGSFARWRARKMAEGVGEAQIKAVHLFSDATKLPPELHP